MPKVVSSNISRKRFGQNLLILTVGEIFARALTFVAFAHLARVLRPDIFGTVEIAMSVVMIASLVVDMGFPLIGAREVSRNPGSVSPLAEKVISAQLLLAILTYATLALFAVVLPLNNQFRILLLGLGISLLGIPFLLMWVFQGRNRMTWVAAPQVLRRLVFALLVISFVRHREQVLALPLAEIGAVGLSAGMLIIIFRLDGNNLKLRPRAALDRALLAQVLPVGGSQLIWAVRMFLPTILLGIMIGRISAGYFAVGHRIMMVVQTIMNVYFLNLFPTMSQAAQVSSNRLAYILHRSLTIIVWPALAIALAVTVTAQLMIRSVYGGDYVRPECITVLQVLIWVIPALALRRHGHAALVALDRPRKEFGCSFMGMLVLSILVLLLTPIYGAIGTACAMLASELITTVFIFACLKSQMPEFSIRRCLTSILSPPEPPMEKASTELIETMSCGVTSPPQKTSPIFIVGAPRSGTTLLSVMLNRHPAIAICHETHFYYYVYLRRRAFGDLNNPERRKLLIERYLGTQRIKKLGLDNEVLADVLMKSGVSYNAFFDALLRCYAAKHGKRRYGDKTPIHSFFVDTLCNWYPDCKIVHLIRDPRDVVASLCRMPWGQGSIIGNARLWRQYVLAADRCNSKENYLLVHYADLVKTPGQELRRICRFIGEEYSDRMLGSENAEFDEQWWFQRARRPVNADRLGLWRRELSWQQAALVEWIAGQTMLDFGFKPEGRAASARFVVSELLRGLLSRARRKLSNLPRVWYYWVQPTCLASEEEWSDRHRTTKK